MWKTDCWKIPYITPKELKWEIMSKALFRLDVWSIKFNIYKVLKTHNHIFILFFILKS